MYFITGGAGAPLYVRDSDPSYAPFYNSTYHFLIIEVHTDNIKEETILTLEAWAMPNDYSEIYLFDNITIEKSIIQKDIPEPLDHDNSINKAVVVGTIISFIIIITITLISTIYIELKRKRIINT